MQPMAVLISILSSMIFNAPQAPLAEPASVLNEIRVLDIGEHQIIPGVVRPLDEAILSTPFDTLLGELRVKEGQHVKRGQIVAILDDRVVRAALKLSETQANRTAQVDHARAVLKQAEDNLARIREARNQLAASEAELFSAETEFEIAAADLRNAQESQTEAWASLELAQTRLEEHMVRAPFDGQVVRIHAQPGTMVSPGSPLIEIVSNGGLCVDLFLPVSIAGDLQVGNLFALSIEDPHPAVIAASVRYIEPRVDPVSRTMRVVFDIVEVEESNLVFAGVLTQPATRLPQFATQQISSIVNDDAKDSQVDNRVALDMD
jgi:HlyD family secretion protein